MIGGALYVDTSSIPSWFGYGSRNFIIYLTRLALPIGAEADASDEATVAKEPGGFDLSPLNSPLIITSSEKKTIIYII